MLYLTNYKIHPISAGEDNEKAYGYHGDSLIGYFWWHHCV